MGREGWEIDLLLLRRDIPTEITAEGSLRVSGSAFSRKSFDPIPYPRPASARTLQAAFGAWGGVVSMSH